MVFAYNMIIILTGNIGSGKTLSAVKEIVDRQQRIFTNFEINGLKHTRLKYDHLFKEDEENKKKMKLNFSFWKTAISKGNFDIYLDEFHNVMNARRSMSKRNVLASDWLSQIRKILGESEYNNLYLMTQKLRRIDINSRDLAQKCIKCIKQEFKDVLIPTEVMIEGKLTVKRLPLTMIYKYHFPDADALNAFEFYGMNTCNGMTRFVGNGYFKYFNSYQLVDFGSQEYV